MKPIVKMAGKEQAKDPGLDQQVLNGNRQ